MENFETFHRYGAYEILTTKEYQPYLPTLNPFAPAAIDKLIDYISTNSENRVLVRNEVNSWLDVVESNCYALGFRDGAKALVGELSYSIDEDDGELDVAVCVAHQKVNSRVQQLDLETGNIGRFDNPNVPF